MDREKLNRLREVFNASLKLQKSSMKNWCKENGIMYRSLKRWLSTGFPAGKKRKVTKGKQALQKVLETIDKAGLSNKIDQSWRNYYDFDS
jgi:hypothetical protein